MSGGVDSSVAAALLRDLGFDVVGLTMRLFDHAAADRASADAARVAAHLGLPHRVLDLRQAFLAEVMRPFAASYRGGETPLPCAVCNRRIKFGALADAAAEWGAAAMATGHYVRRVEGPGGAELRRAADARRDQSYFLFGLSRAQLAGSAFPLGDIAGKAETRRLAAAFGLPVAEKADSQDICFVPGGDYAAAVRELDPDAVRPGEIVDLSGRVLGRHDGIVGFTIGQRRGLRIAAVEPLYVVELDAERHRVVVGPATALDRSSCRLRAVNWLGEGGFDGARVSVKLRSASRAVAATLADLGDGGAEVRLDAPFSAIAPGQACVFYDGDRLLGGGWICRS
jgi:tRNA-specific 2-thiouridylase